MLVESAKVTDEIHTISETIQIIDNALVAPDFNEGDRDVVERSRAFFEQRQQTLLAMAGQSIKSTQHIA